MIPALFLGLVVGFTIVYFSHRTGDKPFFEHHPGVGVAVVVGSAIVAMWITGRIVG